MKHLFLDLEDTVVTPVFPGWVDAELINISKVCAFIEAWQPEQVHVFSFAIQDEADRASFNAHVRGPLEDALGKRIGLVPSTQEHILPACCSVLRLRTSTAAFSDMSEFWGKHESFRLFVRHLFGNPLRDRKVEVALLDDAVLDEDFAWPTLGVKGCLRNVAHLP